MGCMESIYQQPTDLVLGLVHKDITPTFTVIKHAKWQVGQWTFLFQIIGESHAVRIEKNGQHFLTEVLACIELPPENQIHHFANLAAYAHRHEHYTVSVEFEQAKSATLPKMNTSQMIEVAFPEIHGQTPVTRIMWHKTENRVEWQTWHIYPAQNHEIWVKSKTTLEIEQGV